MFSGLLPNVDSSWITGGGRDSDYVMDVKKQALLFKALEGTFEAGPQLVLNLYILTREVICLASESHVIFVMKPVKFKPLSKI